MDELLQKIKLRPENMTNELHPTQAQKGKTITGQLSQPLFDILLQDLSHQPPGVYLVSFAG